MPHTTFILKRPAANVATAIKLTVGCYDGQLQYYTGESIHPDNWPDNLNKGTKAQLNRIESHIERLIVDYKIKGEPLTKGIVAASLDVLLNKKHHTIQGNFFQAMTEVVDRMENGQLLTPQEKRYSKGSIKTFRFTISFLKSFEPGMTIKNISLATYGKFIRHCYKKNYSINYTGSQIKNWKTLGKAIGGNPVFDDPGFKKIQEETFDIYLDEKEIARMYGLELNERMDLVRDWFVLDCYTGLRVSDLLLLTDKNYSKGYVTIANKKTDERVVIPAHPYIKAILKKYKGFPPLITDVELNRVIKKVAEKAKINDDVLFTITKGGVRQDEYLKKWEMVSCHTSRRSFITNLLKNGVPDSIVMKLTGIKSAVTLKRYNKLGVDEAAKIAAKHSFFK